MLHTGPYSAISPAHARPGDRARRPPRASSWSPPSCSASASPPPSPPPSAGLRPDQPSPPCATTPTSARRAARRLPRPRPRRRKPSRTPACASSPAADRARARRGPPGAIPPPSASSACADPRATPPRTAAEPAPEPPPPSGERWGLLPDGDGGWLTPDGREAMPGRDVSVIAAPGGPVRLVDIFPEEVRPEHLEFLEGLSLPEVAELNYAGRVCGYGEQWDPRSRTLWLYGEIPAPRVARGEGRDRPPDDAIWAPPPADADWAWRAARPASAAPPAPPPAAELPPPPPTPEQRLAVRLEPCSPRASRTRPRRPTSPTRSAPCAAAAGRATPARSTSSPSSASSPPGRRSTPAS